MLIKLSFGVAEFLLSRRITRKLTWKYWYPFVTRRLVKADLLFLNYTFVEELEDAPPLELDPEDEEHRNGIGLYHHLAQQLDLKGKKVLEVSCGHGGGASFILRYHHPLHMTAVDLNREGIRFCRERQSCMIQSASIFRQA